VSVEAVQERLAEAVAAYAALADDDPSAPALPEDHGLTDTDVLRCVSALLAAADVEIFELAIWQLWSQRKVGAGRE
jgi:hypothetical protein